MVKGGFRNIEHEFMIVECFDLIGEMLMMLNNFNHDYF